MEDFLLWNPSITADCGNYLTGRSYCVEAPAGGAEPPPTTTTTGPAPTDGNGAETPLPTRPDMASNCDDFYYVEVGDSCPSITAGYGIITAQFIDGTLLSAPTAPGSGQATIYPTTPPYAIETPLPIQPGMVDNCDAFHLVKAGDLRYHRGHVWNPHHADYHLEPNCRQQLRRHVGQHTCLQLDQPMPGIIDTCSRQLSHRQVVHDGFSNVTSSCIEGKPTFVNIKTVTGLDSSVAGTAVAHGAAFGSKSVAEMKTAYGFDPDKHFAIGDTVRLFFQGSPSVESNGFGSGTSL
ncbi:hypothetical protein N7497_001117 [Penicillium chrysogenum]|nr:hypothetical protein N7497_001117 [Penicillium chrysogenum]